MLDLDGIRARIRARFGELGIKLTGNWDDGLPISRSTVRHFVEGRTHSITLDTASKLAGVLETTEEWILFGLEPGQPIALSEQDLAEMVGTALEELQDDMTPEEIVNTVASNLHGQLRRKRAGATVRRTSGAEIARDKFSRSAPPTTQDVPAE